MSKKAAKVSSEEPAKYGDFERVPCELSSSDMETVSAAIRILKGLVNTGDPMTRPTATAQYLQLKIGHLPHEVFMCMFLDNQHKVIATEELFRGTIDCASVYPREVVKAALKHNAAAVIFAHNHPSGIAEPSLADRLITEKLKQALDTVDIRTLDHFVVGVGGYVSFAEQGII